MKRLGIGDRSRIGVPVGVTGRTPAQYFAVFASRHLANSGNTLMTLLQIAWQRAGLGVVSKRATSADPETRRRSPKGTRPKMRASSAIGSCGRPGQASPGTVMVTPLTG